ncbi:matrixin family metalloprotease [Persephonella sp.]
MHWILIFFLLIFVNTYSATDYECIKKYKYTNGIKLKDNKGSLYIDDLVPEGYYKAILRTKEVLESIANIHLDIKKTSSSLSKLYVLQKKKKVCEYKFKKNLEKGIYITVDNNQDCIENKNILGICSFYIHGCEMVFPTLIVLYKNKLVSDYILQSTVSHEIGHAIGLDHPQNLNTSSVMSYKYGGEILFFSKEDIDVLQKIYGIPTYSMGSKLSLYKPLGKKDYYCVIGGKYPLKVNRYETTCKYEETYDINCWKVKHKNCFFVVNSSDNQKLIVDDKGNVRVEGYSGKNYQKIKETNDKGKYQSSEKNLHLNKILSKIQHYQLVLSILLVLAFIILILILRWYWKQREKDGLIAQIYDKAIYDIWIYLPLSLKDKVGNPENLKKLSKDKENLKAVLKNLEIKDLKKILEKIYTQPNRTFHFDYTPVEITAFKDDTVRLRDPKLEGIELVIFYRNGNYYLKSNLVSSITVNNVNYASNIDIPLSEENIIEFKGHELRVTINKEKGSVDVKIIK